jgi:uncharacterized protein (TIGR00730 family)
MDAPPPRDDHNGERRYLAGPQSWDLELAHALRIFVEYARGLRALHFVGPCVTVFGSARVPPTDPLYDLGRRTGARFAEAGFTVMTGGGPGLMEAASRGAHEVGGRSVGCNIRLPVEQRPNPYLDRVVEFRHFFIRKVMLVKYSYAFVALPGGFGTFDEMFETATLVQTGKIRDFPIVLLGEEFWRPVLDALRATIGARALVSEADLDRFFLCDTPEAAVAHVLGIATHAFGRRYRSAGRRWWRPRG